MATEIERKFLVKGKFMHHAVNQLRIKQSYLSLDPDRIVRLRIAGEKAFFTIKGRLNGTSLSRNEWEIQIPVADATEIMKICLPGTIDKTRYFVPVGQHIFEVDVFHGKNEGLIIAEIELASEKELFDRPEWLGREVTGNPSFYNANLIK
jgi:adenylate cyclase